MDNTRWKKVRSDPYFPEWKPAFGDRVGNGVWNWDQREYNRARNMQNDIIKMHI